MSFLNTTLPDIIENIVFPKTIYAQYLFLLTHIAVIFSSISWKYKHDGSFKQIIKHPLWSALDIFSSVVQYTLAAEIILILTSPLFGLIVPLFLIYSGIRHFGLLS